MIAKIKKTNSGDMCIAIEADKESMEELFDLTELTRQTMQSNNTIEYFGGSGGLFGKDKDKMLDYSLNLIVRGNK